MNKITVKCTEIQWDTDGDKRLLKKLPKMLPSQLKIIVRETISMIQSQICFPMNTDFAYLDLITK